jgi:hypothetical protein
MLNPFKLFFYCFLLFLFIFPDNSITQDMKKNAVNIWITRSTPGSDITFNKRYVDIYGLGLSFHHYFNENIFGGVSYNYSKFQIEQTRMPFALQTKLDFSNPSILVGYDYEFLADSYLNCIFQAGYSWLQFSNKDYNDEARANNSSGFSFEPFISVSYKTNSFLRVGIQTAYKLIFCNFGKKSEFSPDEDSSVRYWSYGLFISFAF